MQSKNAQGILYLLGVAVLSFGIVIGTKTLTEAIKRDQNQTEIGTENEIKEEIRVEGAEGIRRAGKLEDGRYLVTSAAKGYGGEIVLDVIFDANAEKIVEVKVAEHSETEGVGSKVADSAFLQQFFDVTPPIVLSGMEGAPQEDIWENAVFLDGTYEKKSEADSSGFIDQVTVVIENGMIQDVVWDSISEEGQSKSTMSEEGNYTMTEDGLSWAQQAKALGDAVVADQSLARISPDETGKIDTVAGVSISVSGFVSLTKKCLMEAANIEETQTQNESVEGTGIKIDAVSGATISSTAMVKAINEAWEFLKEKR